MSFVGSHLDVVPANPETWERNPFKLEREGDKLFGRGTTDCLGHVALITELFIQLAEKKVQLNTNLVAIFIARYGCNSKYCLLSHHVDAALSNDRVTSVSLALVFVCMLLPLFGHVFCVPLSFAVLCACCVRVVL